MAALRLTRVAFRQCARNREKETRQCHRKQQRTPLIGVTGVRRAGQRIEHEMPWVRGRSERAQQRYNGRNRCRPRESIFHTDDLNTVLRGAPRIFCAIPEIQPQAMRRCTASRKCVLPQRLEISESVEPCQDGVGLVPWRLAGPRSGRLKPGLRTFAELTLNQRTPCRPEGQQGAPAAKKPSPVFSLTNSTDEPI